MELERAGQGFASTGRRILRLRDLNVDIGTMIVGQGRGLGASGRDGEQAR
jgi:hypothetical protein